MSVHRFEFPLPEAGWDGVWFTSDSHFGHRNILHLGAGRSFDSIEEHDRELVARWNAVVRPDDLVFHLGDLSMSPAAMEMVVPSLLGRIVMVAGNHDACWTRNGIRMGKSFRAVQRYLDAGIDQVAHGGQLVAVVGEVELPLMSHLPARGDHQSQSRYDEFRPVTDSPLLCGHVHHAWTQSGLQVNVGVDRWNFAPVNWTTLTSEFPFLSAGAR